MTENMNRNKKAGFTMAEIMIAITIIAVVAALVIPRLIIRLEKHVAITRLKKSFNILSQTTSRAVSEHGPINTWNLGQANNTEDAKTFAKTYITPYLKLQKDAATIEEGGWLNEKYPLNSNKKETYPAGNIRFYLLDGQSVTMRIMENNNINKRIYLYIDTNGDKKPNKLGRDLFVYGYWILDGNKKIRTGKFVPDGDPKMTREQIKSNTNGCSKTKKGEHCALLIKRDHWQMLDDYPW